VAGGVGEDAPVVALAGQPGRPDLQGPRLGRVIEIGAIRLPGEGDDWRVFADPAGHPFCLVFNPK